MTKPYNIALRVKHFNSRIKIKEGRIKFDKSAGKDKQDPLSYTSGLFQNIIRQGWILEVYEGLVTLYSVNYWKDKYLITAGQSFLHVLFYLAHQKQEEIALAKLAIKAKAQAEKEAKAKTKLPLINKTPTLFDFIPPKTETKEEK